MSFTAELRDIHADLFEAFWAHPFFQGLLDGTATRDAVVHYVGQDVGYLQAFLRCYGLGQAMAPTPDWTAFFMDGARIMLEEEPDAHRALVEHFGVDYEACQESRLAPTAKAYANHMELAGHDTLGVLMAALLPCQWTYTWAALRAEREQAPGADHPFRAWFDFYTSEECQQLVVDYRRRTDALAAAAGTAERQRMAEAFADSLYYEVAFWQMAATGETWDRLPARVLGTED
ncbi:thiaminase (transcriptional activator TenA) [Raineyella antarctica]|uniref:Aminopyrimidine aminohydrolase n=1 Tax=Raineyella antarctica TaxID=1577474 RepID=A0A1G6GRM9_9ACTN|nr:thiaminase II [Raineyella antarctica]SDB84608.1 thiaminase (transcriptional activator TenA) [Raineyella antarctica]